jgi:secreted PhoX family phosphatase
VVTCDGRRQFLKFLGAGLTGACSGGLGPLARAAAGPPAFIPFEPIRPTTQDDLVLAGGFGYDLLLTWGERLPGTTSHFGYNPDFTAFVPMPDAREGLLFVNHEYVSLPDEGEYGVYPQTFPLVMGRAPTIEDEMRDVGASVLHLRRSDGGRWEVIASPLTRRYDAGSKMLVSGPALARERAIVGTLANCSGCHTPWNTVLTCEENFQDCVPAPVDTTGRGRVGGRFDRDGSHFGWVVEIDPFDPAWTPVKHTMLGRFRHENVAIRTDAGGHVVAYMGDDIVNGHVYKFVSTGGYAPEDRRSRRGTVLSAGRLYAAVFRPDGTGEWRELAGATPLRPNPASAHPPIPRRATTLGQVYTDEGAIVTDALQASNLIGATPTGRPEDIEIHPIDRSVYIAFTAGATAPGHLFPNPYGEIWRLVDEADGAGVRFTWMRWKAGGPNDPSQAGHVFAAPDNLVFDPAGHLWIVCDITSSRLNAHSGYTAFANNGMFLVPASGPDSGVALQFASAPCEAEFSGPSWTADRSTLFLSVQHPGEASGMRTSPMKPPRGSNWPDRRADRPPRPAVVVVRAR